MSDSPKPRPIPASRASRFLRLGGVATGIAGSVAWGGARQLASGQRPELRDLVLTPANITRLTDQLARMRGAAMKVGQLMSMDAGEVLPPELTQILGRLRDMADFMPPPQLRQVLNDAWGQGWLSTFKTFEPRPLAAASIGQVHLGLTKDGRDLAIKVQYPGIKDSIDSDVANVATLVRLSGLLPPGLDIAPMIEEARRQLHEEADYAREAGEMRAFADLLANDDRFMVPRPADDLCTDAVLAMTFTPGQPMDVLDDADQDTRNRVAQDLIELTFAELFDYGRMQTDPNFANYRYQPDTGRIVLLDFGASRPIAEPWPSRYRAYLRAALTGDGIEDAAIDLGLFAADTADHHKRAILDMSAQAFATFDSAGTFDFGDKSLMKTLSRQGAALANDRSFTHVPPIETLFLNRKLTGMFLLASRLRAKLPARALLEAHL